MFKRITAALVSALFLCMPLSSGAAEEKQELPEELKILCIGNSFSCDTIEHVANIALSLGVKKVTLGNLYIGGCSIRKHYANATADSKSYEYFYNTGSGWSSTKGHSIKATLESEDWDYISIQHGTADGSRYAEEEYYKDLAPLIKYIRQYVKSETKIAFNMTWVGEPNSHEEMVAFGNDQLKYYQAVAKLTSDHVASIEGVDIVSPTGTAIQNARSADIGLLTRDNYHLCLGLGRYIAGLTFFKALTGADITNIGWAPESVYGYKRELAIESVNNAFNTRYSVTQSKIVKPEFVWPPNAEYGSAATPSTPFYAHAAKDAPEVEQKIELLKYFNLSEGVNTITSTLDTSNSMGLVIDLKKTPYLYYSIVVPSGSDFCFSIYSDANYAPWLSFLDASAGDAVLSDGAEKWDSLFSGGRKQYAKTTQSGCIDLRDYAKGDSGKWVISRLKLYAPKGDEVVLSYFFLGSEPTKAPDASDDASEEISENTSEEISQEGSDVDEISEEEASTAESESEKQSHEADKSFLPYVLSGIAVLLAAVAAFFAIKTVKAK
jgi:hypothetical protein